MKKCRFCAEEIQDAAVICKHCGRRLASRGWLCLLLIGATLLIGIVAVSRFAWIMTNPLTAKQDDSNVTEYARQLELANMTTSASAEGLFEQYRQNEVAADAQFRGRRINLTGVTAEVVKDVFGHVYVNFQTPNQFTPVRAKLRESDVPRAASVTPGQQLSLICKGNGMVIGSPMLDDCVFQ